MMEGDEAQATPDAAKGMKIAAAFARPALEPDTQLEAAVRRAEELGLVQPQHLVEQADTGNGGLTDTYRSDRVGFDQGDAGGRWCEPGKGRCRHPTGRAAADDHDPLSDMICGRGGVHAASHETRADRLTGAGVGHQKR
ncbi:hypothetical protein GCM10020258_48180 [Sphingomonas yabuuchiae]